MFESDPSREPAEPSRSGARGDARRWWRAVAIVGALSAVMFSAELVVRIFDLGSPVYQPRRFEPGGGVPFTEMPNGPLVYVPNATFASVYDPAGDKRGYFGPNGRVGYEINKYGMRGPALLPEKGANSFRVVCLGDSITFGEGVKYDDTYPALLESELARAMPDRRVETINAGVQTYGTLDCLYFFGMRCEQFGPDAVTLGFFLNDVTDRAETIRQNEAHTRALELSPFSRVSRICELIERSRRGRRLQAEYFATTRASFESHRWEECKEALGQMAGYGKEKGFRFLVVVFPILWELDGDYPFADIHARISESLGAAGVECIDLLEIYRGRSAEDLWVHPTDQHPNEIAHRLAAARIARRLLESAN